MSTTCCEQETCGELAEALGKAKADAGQDRLRELVASAWHEGYQTACTHRGGLWEQSGAARRLALGAVEDAAQCAEVSGSVGLQVADNDRWRTDFEKEPLPTEGSFRAWLGNSSECLLWWTKGILYGCLFDAVVEIQSNTVRAIKAWRPVAKGPLS